MKVKSKQKSFDENVLRIGENTMIKSYEFIKNKRRIKIVKEYLNLLEQKHYQPKNAYIVICQKYHITRKTIYNYMTKFKNLPLRSF